MCYVSDYNSFDMIIKYWHDYSNLTWLYNNINLINTCKHVLKWIKIKFKILKY